MAGVQPRPPNFSRMRDRVSLDEFEEFETLLKMQSQNLDEGNWMETLRDQGVLCDGEFDDEEDAVLLDGQRHLQLNTSEEEALANQGVLFSTDDLTTDDQREMPPRYSNLPASHQYNDGTYDKVADNGGFDEFLHKSPSPYSIDQEQEPDLSYLDDDDDEREGSIPSDRISEDFSSYSDGHNVRDNGDDNPERYLILNHHNTLARTIHAGVSPHPDSFTRDSDPIPFSRNQSIRSSLRSLRSEESGSVALDKFLDPELERTIQEVASQVESFASPRHSSADGRPYIISENEMDTTGQVTSYMTEEVNDVDVNDSYNPQRLQQMWKDDSAVESYQSDSGPGSESANLNLGNFVPKAVLRNRPPKPSTIKLLQNGVLPNRPPKPSAINSPAKTKSRNAIINFNGEENEQRSESERENDNESSVSSSVGQQRTLRKNHQMGSLSNFSIDSDLPADELIDQLKHEKSTRRQNDELVDRLQLDYDQLLQKYALAEVTIDQLRLGAKVNLYTDPPPVTPNSRNNTPRANQPQTIHLAQPQRAAVVDTTTESHQKSVNGSMMSPYGSPANGTSPGRTAGTGAGQRSPEYVDRRGGATPGDVAGRGQGTSQSEHDNSNPSFPEFTGSEGIAIGLQFQTRGLEEQVQVFETQLVNDELKPSEQDQIMSKLRAEHEKLEQDYMQAKEEHQARRRMGGNLSNETFDLDRELEGEIFQLGMKLDAINETVENNLRNQRPETPPTRRDFFPEHSIEDEIERQRLDMDQQYDTLMDRYDQLKNSTNYPNRNQDIEDLVMTLENLHHQDPTRYPPPKQAVEKASTLPGQFLSTSQLAVGQSSPGGTSSKGEISFASTPGKTPDTSNIVTKKGSASKIPRWNSSMIHEGSISESTTSPETIRRNPAMESHKNGSSKSVLHPVPRQGSQDSQGTGSRQKSPELDRDSGFMGSESSRQSQLTNHYGVGTVTLNGPGKTSTGVHPLETELVLPTRTRRSSFQRQPSYDCYDGPMTLHLESDPEEQSMSQSEQTTVRYQPPRQQQQHRKTPLTNGHSRIIHNKSKPHVHAKQTLPPASTYQDYLTPQASECLPNRHPSTPYPARNRSKTVPDTRQPERLNTRPRRDVDPRSERTIPNGLHEEIIYPSRLLKSDLEGLHEDDSVSNASRSSVKSAKLNALEEEIDQLKNRLSENSRERANDSMPPHHRKEFSRRRAKVPSGSASDTSSIKTEVLHSLQDEVRNLKSRLSARDRVPQESGHASNGNDLRKTLRETYIPNLPSRVDNKTRSPDRNHRIRSASSDVGSTTSHSRRYPLRVSQGHAKNLPRTKDPHTSICSNCQGSGICSHDDQISQSYRYGHTPQTSQQTYLPSNYAPNDTVRAANTNGTPHNVTFAPSPQQSYTGQSPSQPGYSPQFSQPQYVSTPVAHTPQYVSTPIAHSTPQFMSTPISQPIPQYVHTPVAQPFTSPQGQQTPQYISTPMQPSYAPPAQTSSPPQQQMTVREYIPVHNLPSKTNARFYVRNREKRSRSQTSSEEEEFYYRRSPHSKYRSPTRSYVNRGHGTKESDARLEAAIRVARHLKSTSKRMLSSVQHDLNNSLSIRDILT